MQNKWGTYPWFLEHGIDQIHPDDLEKFKKKANNCKVYECVDEDAQFITIKYGNTLFKVKDSLFKSVPEPKFQIGQMLKLQGKSDSEIIVTDIMWHYEKKEHYYLLTVNGKKKTKRYFESEFEL